MHTHLLSCFLLMHLSFLTALTGSYSCSYSLLLPPPAGGNSMRGINHRPAKKDTGKREVGNGKGVSSTARNTDMGRGFSSCSIPRGQNSFSWVLWGSGERCAHCPLPSSIPQPKENQRLSFCFMAHTDVKKEKGQRTAVGRPCCSPAARQISSSRDTGASSARKDAIRRGRPRTAELCS